MNRPARLRGLRRLALCGIAAGAVALGGILGTVTTAAAQTPHVQTRHVQTPHVQRGHEPLLQAAPTVSRVARRVFVPRIVVPRIPVRPPRPRLHVTADDLRGNPDTPRESPSGGRGARRVDGGALVDRVDAD